MFIELTLEMQNSKCKVQNYGVSFGNDFKIIGEADTIILHFAFYILHLQRKTPLSPVLRDKGV